MRIFKSLAEAEAEGFFSITGTAKKLGRTRQYVDMTHKRRENTGFPPIAAMYWRDGCRKGPVFEWNAVERWAANYTPNRGGRVASTV